MEQNPLVLITGATGYIGSHVVNSFLQHGGFRIRITVRSKNNSKKMDPLVQFFGERWNEIDVVEADLLNEESIINACEGCTYVCHVASPVPTENVKDEMTVITPAVTGTLAVMKGAQKHKVKRVVYCGSIAAIFTPKGWTKEMTHFDSSMWRDTDSKMCDAYGKSKTFSE